MAKLESADNFTSKSSKICALHRALHHDLDFDGFAAIDGKSKQHERSVRTLDRRSESDFDDFGLIPEKQCIKTTS